MKRRIKKKIEQRRRESIHRLIDLALDINGLGMRKQNVTGNLPTVFIYYSGHVANISVKIHSYGWRIDDAPDKKVSAYTDNASELECAVRQLEEIKAETPAAGTARESGK